MKLELRPTNLSWITGKADDPADLCAHGGVYLAVGEDVLFDGTGDYTVSAAALFLLRTLTRSHTREAPVAERLFPHCGNGLFDTGDDVTVLDCNSGDDLEVRHEGPITSLGRWEVEGSAWREAVFAFADAVKAFYDGSAKKEPATGDVAGFKKFFEEWERRRSDGSS